MRALRIVLIILGLALFSIPAHAEWCAVYRNGGNNCGFQSFQQCMASVSGLGGFCNASPYSSSQRTEPHEKASNTRRVSKREAEQEPKRERVHQAKAKPVRQTANRHLPSEKSAQGNRGMKLSPGDDDNIMPAEPN
jgi:uncharacterized protein DUF3551